MVRGGSSHCEWTATPAALCLPGLFVSRVLAVALVTTKTIIVSMATRPTMWIFPVHLCHSLPSYRYIRCVSVRDQGVGVRCLKAVVVLGC